MRPEDYEEENSVFVFPQNVQSFQLFDYLCTQWLMGPSGPYGLNYQTMYQKLDRMNLSAEDSARLEADMLVMEHAALKKMRENRD